eukprot:111081-Ditylum_brightwellii.AAC.2
MDRLKQSKHCGPILFYIMMEIFSSMSAKAKWALITCMKKLSLYNFDEEDVDALLTIILGIIKRLKMLNTVPEDMSRIVIFIYKTCSVEAFQCMFLMLNNQMRISGKHLTPEKICNFNG